MGVKQWVRAMLVLSALPSAAMALGLGDIRLNSSLNSPLDAEIELVNATPEELASLRAQLATRETFARYGLEWPSFLQSVTLTRAQAADGREVLRLRSRESITEPFVTLLVDVNWGRGRLVREYTVLLDPPVFSPTQTPAPEVAAPSTGAARSGNVERAPSAPAPSAAAPSAAGPAVARAPAVPFGADPYSVRRGDTLSGIASQVAAGQDAGVEQVMLALYQNNPAAFEGSMNDLRAGAIMQVPDSAALAAVSRDAAVAEVRRQRAAWLARSPEAADTGGAGRLRLVAPSDAGAGAPGSGGGDAATQQRLAQLESELAESQRLLALRNTELAQLQARLARATGSPVPEPVAPAPATDAPVAVDSATGETAVDPTAPLLADDMPAPTDSSAMVEEPIAATPPAPSRSAVVEPPVEEPSFLAGLFDALKQFWYLPLALLALIAGFLGFRRWQASRDVDPDDTFVNVDAAAAELSMPPPGSDTARLRRPNISSPAERSGVLVEESGEYASPQLGREQASSAKSVSAEDTFSGETGINLDQGDPLAEADFHMAYGLYDQAADLVRLASAREPERADLKLKLAEVYFVWGNRDAFLESAKDLQVALAGSAPGEWEKVVIMGRQIAPEVPMFASASVRAAGAAGAALDLRLDGGDSPVDFDVFGDGSGSTVERARPTTTDFDPIAPDFDDDSTGERPGIDAPTELINRGGGTTREMAPKFAAQSATVVDDLGFDFGARTSPDIAVDLGADLGADLGPDTGPDMGDAPTIERPSLRSGSPTIREKLDAARRGGSTDQTAEMPLDDLGLNMDDVPGLDAPDAAESADAPTMLANLDEAAQRLMARTAAGAKNKPAPDKPGLDNEREQDIGSTSMMAALDLSQFEATGTHRVNGELDLNIGSPTLTDLKKLPADSGADADDLTLPSLEPVTISEVGTKLDLARAYMDMGDPDGARNILSEVLHEGSVSQKQEAQRLIDALPG